MAYNYLTGQYEPDQPGGFNFGNWFQGANNQPDMRYAYNNPGQQGVGSQPFGIIGDGTVPGGGGPPSTSNPRDVNNDLYQNAPINPNPGGPMDPNSDYFKWWSAQHSGDPYAPTADPATVTWNSSTVVPSLTQPGAPAVPLGTGNSGTDRNNPPDQSGDWFWSGTANHWVDSTGKRDATGRALTGDESAWWKTFDRNRASGIPNNETFMATNPGLANQIVAPAAAVAVPNLPTASTAQVPTAPETPQQNYSNLYGGFGQGWQQGFNELNNKQFTSGSDSFNQAFGSTGGTGLGNNFNWNIFPDLVSDSLDDNFKQAAIKVAAANPQYDFEPTMVDGKWVLGSRARDQASQIALLKPQLPTTPTGGGGARISSGYGVANGKGGTTAAPTKGSGVTYNAKPTNFGGSLGIGSARPAPVNANVPNTSLLGRDGRPLYGGGSASNVPYVPVSGTGSGYTPLNPNIPQPAPYVPPSNNGRRLEDPMPPKTYIGPGPTGVAPGVPGDYDGQISPDGLYMWGARGQYWYKR